jgi:hypothetical protein
MRATPDDTSMAHVEEVEAAMKGKGAWVIRRQRRLSRFFVQRPHRDAVFMKFQTAIVKR